MKKLLIALGAAVLLAGCGSSSAAVSLSPSAAPSYPTDDVVSAIATDATIAGTLPAAVRSRGTIILGTTITPGVNGLPHGGQLADGTNIGLDVDLRNAVAKVLGLKWDVQNGTFPTIIPGVQNGKYDVGMDNFGVTKPREEVVDFATYLTDGQAFLAPSSSDLNQVTDITDLCGKTLATSPGSTFQQILESSKAKCATAGKQPYTVQYFADTAPIWLGLANGKIDVYFGPTLSLKYDATHIANTKFLSQFSSTPVGFVTAKGSPLAPALTAAVNKLIASGDYAKILAKWGVPDSGIPKSAINPPSSL
ncbi:MAG TPA: ABC transporter substrate-binding protein [Actinoplanes sp.]